jgi:hypothetical protein
VRPDRSVRLPAIARAGGTGGPPWEEDFAAALRRGDPLAASTILRATGVDGRIRKAQLGRARRIVDAMAPASLVRRDWASRLLLHPRRIDKELAAAIVAPLAASHPADVERAVLRLARDDRWDVRESAASLLGEALDAAFERYLSTCREWMARPEPRVRRAIAVAARRAARARAPERAGALLDLVEPALRDRDEQVRRGVGPMAIGGRLMRSYPDVTLARLERWAADPDEAVRWNVATSLGSAAGARLADRALPLLRALARDPSELVSRAADAALRRVRERRPDVVPA